MLKMPLDPRLSGSNLGFSSRTFFVSAIGGLAVQSWWLGSCLEDHPRICKWLITMVSFRSLRIGLWDPETNWPFCGDPTWG